MTQQQPEAPKVQPLTDEQISQIASVRIHPGIGVSRVGNSEDEYYIGPEVLDPPLAPFGSTRDASGAIKRQAARFRLYGYDCHGKVVAEVTPSANTEVEWTVHMANRKGQWFEFDAAMDLQATKNISVDLRNPHVKGKNREALAIDPGAKSITGSNTQGSEYQLNGNFQGTGVLLGELRTDSDGRLLVLPGHGVSASPENTPIFIKKKPGSFNNAAGWYDDIADGPVSAKVTINGQAFDADRAWVISSPPNFGQDLTSWRTLDDLLRSTYIQAGMMSLPAQVSFQDHVRPILERMTGLQWVNKGISAMFGGDAPLNFQDVGLMEKLAMKPPTGGTDTYGELRRTVYNSFRSTNGNEEDISAWPWEYGDTYGYSDPKEAQAVAALQYLRLPAYYDYFLTAWVKGDFESDYKPNARKAEVLEDLPLAEQPESLDRSAMHFCLADAFHPGCELTWPIRHASMYRAPYRIKERPAGVAEPDYGTKLDQDKVLSMNGPLYEQGPGDLSRWMALPWQGDTAYCRSGYDMEYDPYVPTFWPAHVPNQVLTLDDYNIVCDTSKTKAQRLAAFHNRPSWLRQLPAKESIANQMIYMVEHFGEMGVLEAKPRPADMPELPEMLYVENLKPAKQSLLSASMQDTAAPEALTDEQRMLKQAGWESVEQRDEFLNIKFRGRV